MSLTVDSRNRSVLELLNGVLFSLKAVVPIQHEVNKPQTLQQPLLINYGVLIGFLGDINGKLLLKGHQSIFGSIGEAMFGMAVEGEMLTSFTGELGNMIAGSLSTNISEKGIKTDITSPTVMDGETKLSGYQKAISLVVNFDGLGTMDIQLLLD